MTGPTRYRIATHACLDAIKARSRRVPSLSSFRDVPWLEPYPDELLEQVAPADEEPAAAAVSPRDHRAHVPRRHAAPATAPAVSAPERRLLDRFVETHENGDVEAALALLAEDIRVTMPPEPLCFTSSRPARTGCRRRRAPSARTARSRCTPSSSTCFGSRATPSPRSRLHGRHLAAFGLPETLTPAGLEALRAAV